MKVKLLKRFFFFLSSSVLVCSCLQSQAQTQFWASRYNGSASQTDQASVIYVDGAGNSYVAGLSYTTLGGEDGGLVKYDIDGNELWARTFDAAPPWSGNIDWFNAVAVDGAGNVFVTGYTTNVDSTSLMVVKYDASGTLQWTRYFGTPGSVQDEGMAITTDDAFVYVTGKAVATTFPPYHDYMTAKFDLATGTMQPGWPQRFNGFGNNEDVPASIAVDVSGNVFVTGSSMNSSGDKDYGTVVYNASGVMAAGWPQVLDGPGFSEDIPAQLLLSGNHVIVTGHSTGNGTNWDICTVVYDYSGQIVSGWPQRYDGVASGNDGVGNTGSSASYKPMIVDASGNIYLTGWTTNTTGNYDMITFKYDASGVLQPGWPQLYDSTGMDDIARGITLDISNNVYITGFSAPATTFNNGDYVTIAYSNNGNLLAGWPAYYNGTASGDDQAQAISSNNSCVFVTGYSGGSTTFSDFLTIKYCDNIVRVHELSSGNQDIQFFPNPSDGHLNIQNAQGANLTIRDMLGQTVFETKVTTFKQEIDLSKFAKGVYSCMINSGSSLLSEKKIVIE